MSSPPALVVPVQLDALSANASLLGRDGFRWWRYDYSALDEFASPEPVAQDREITGGGAGVYLHWVVPDSLRRGAKDPATGLVSYPKVPNRWLLARFVSTSSGVASKAWVIESDCPFGKAAREAGHDPAQSSMYLVEPALAQTWAKSPDPYRNSVILPGEGKTPFASIGLAFPLASWSERDPHATFLTALAPGNPAFPIYTPHNRGVFSFYDDMADVPVNAETVSYAIVGWYSDPEDDPLASWPADTSSKNPYLEALEALGWKADPASPAATSSLYQGFALKVAWDPAGAPPSGESDPLEALKHSTALDVAVGNTTIDAFTSLLAARNQQIGATGSELLRAFQYDLLPLLDDVNGSALLERSVRAEWYGGRAGGYRWEIVAAETGDPVEGLLSGEETVLAQLSADQQDLDLALAKLEALQWRFHELWWKAGRWQWDQPESIPSVEALTDQLDPGFVDSNGVHSAAKQLLDQLAIVREAAEKVPQPAAGITDPQAALEAGIAAFASSKKLNLQQRVLKAVEAPRYQLPNDPVVVLSGVQPPTESQPGQTVSVRSAGALVAQLTVGGAVASTATMPALAASLPDSAQVPAEALAAIREWLFLDSSNAAAIAHAIGKSAAEVEAATAALSAPGSKVALPAIGLADWVQPWQPMYLEWEVAYAAVPHLDAQGRSQWTFDGEDYTCAPTGPQPQKPEHLSGISLLSPHAQIVLGSQLKSYIERYGGAELEALYAESFGGSTQLPVLAQALTGLNAQLAGRDQRAMRRPDPAERTPASGSEKTFSVAELAGYPDAGAEGLLAPRYRGAVTTVPLMVAGVSKPFNPIRQGQMWFTYVAVYDKFGRVLTVVQNSSSESGLHDAANFPAIVDPAMQPEVNVEPKVRSVAELPPRILQPARLDFDLCDSDDDGKLLWQDPSTNPVCGWVLPNHLDRSLLLYGPTGAALGEMRLTTAADGSRTANWEPPPHSDIDSLSDVQKVAPRLAKMIESPALAAPAAFEALLEAIDTTLWTTDPLGGRRDQELSVLIGRPLALVRASLQLSLKGPPWSDTSWRATFAPPSDAVHEQPFFVRLGDLATRDDGLIGYFEGEDYEALNTVATPQERTSQKYVRPIGSPLTDGSANYLSLLPDAAQAITMLVDPRAGVHATSGALPVVRAELPGPFVAAALKAVEVTFRLEPALTYAQPTPVVEGKQPEQPESVVLPVPAERAGTWTFWDREPKSESYGLLPATPEAELKPYPLTLRDGLLQLLVDVNEKPESN
jgi:hypothetical protein